MQEGSNGNCWARQLVLLGFLWWIGFFCYLTRYGALNLILDAFDSALTPCFLGTPLLLLTSKFWYALRCAEHDTLSLAGSSELVAGSERSAATAGKVT